jgi:RimJ/RimL family protein N-acetyltransferase
MSGTGKSAALAELGRRGHRVVDSDDPGWREYRPYHKPADDLHRGEWLLVEDRMNALLDAKDDRSLFVGGGARNQSKFYDRFDAVVLLTAPTDVLLDRVASRTSNEYGKTELERAEILADLAEIEPILRQGCTHELDASRPLDAVVADLIAIAHQTNGLAHKLFSAALPATDVPNVETRRLLLRGWRLDDVAPMTEINADPEVAPWLGFPDPSRTEERIRAWLDHWQHRGFGLWAVQDKGTGAFIGRLGLVHHDDWNASTHDAEIGWALARSAWGRGYATEGALAAMAFAREIGLRRIISITRPDNIRSQRVMEKIGLAYAGRTRWHSWDQIWYEIELS